MDPGLRGSALSRAVLREAGPRCRLWPRSGTSGRRRPRAADHGGSAATDSLSGARFSATVAVARSAILTAIAPFARIMLERGRECIASVIQRITETEAGGEELSSILMSCFDGLAIQKIIDPSFDVDRAYKTLEKIFRPVLEAKPEP